MVVHILKPQVIKEWVDAMVAKGAKAVVVSTDKDGTFNAPSKKCNRYKLPMAIGGNVFRGESNLSKVMGGSRLVLPIDDLDWLSDEALSKMQEPKEHK